MYLCKDQLHQYLTQFQTFFILRNEKCSFLNILFLLLSDVVLQPFFSNPQVSVHKSYI